MENSGEGGRDDPRTWPSGGASGSGNFALPARWKLGRLLGSGGQAEVWLAQDQEVGEWVAIKVFGADLSETDRERLRREVRLGRSLQHPGLVRLFELVESSGRLALVMEWMPSGSLVRRLEGGPLPIDEVIRVAEEALEILEYLHANGVVHRDVKPSNLLLDNDGNVKLADLGLARPLEEDRDVTRTNTTVGTPGFMSPEQLRGENVAPASDLYSLGVTLYQLLTGVQVFEAVSQFEVARRHLASRPRDPRELRPDCPRWFARFVLRLLEKRPEDRWPDAGGARLALHRRAGLTPPRVLRNLTMTGAAVVVVALGLVYVGRIAFDRFWHPVAERIEASGREVRGLDARGTVVWKVAFENPIRQIEQVDLTGDGVAEIMISAWPVAFRRSTTPERSEVAILDRRGDVISRLVPEEAVSYWPFDYPVSFNPTVHVVAIGRNGEPAVAVNCRHAIFYPTVVLVYWPRTGVWEPALYHTGWLTDLAPVQGSDPPRLRFEGVNNRLCMYPVVGELVVNNPDPSAVRQQRAVEISESVSDHLDGGFSLAWYTPLDLQGPTHGALELAGNGNAVLRYPTATLEVDRFGNPVPGPNAGRDLVTERRAFLTDLSALVPGNQPVSAAGVSALLDGLRLRHADLLRERPYRTILDTLAARALARVGGLQDAIRMLRRLRNGSDAPEVTLRLAHLEAVAGNLDEAKRLAQEVLDGANANRRYDAAQLLRHLAFETRDVEGVRRAATAIGYFEQSNQDAAGITATLWVSAHLWWDELTDTDTRCIPSPLASAAEAAACVARWRLGRTAPGDLEAMKACEETNPEVRRPCRAARAAALLGLGRAREAASLLNDVSAQMESTAPDDFEDQQGLGLARAIYAKALLAAGERDQAVRLARRWQQQLRPGLLPRILVDEVLKSGTVDGR